MEIRSMRCAILLAFLVAAVTFSGPAWSEDFYRGKTVHINVGYAAGGGFDTYARAIARHFGKHIPGNPAVIVENMTGAAGVVLTNFLYHRAKPDGLTIGNFIGTLILQQVLGRKGIEFDGRKFEWVGVPVQDMNACALTKASGITSLEKWFAAKEAVKLGGESPGANDSDGPRALKAALGLPIQLVEGYKGTAQIRLAAEAGEIAGGCWTWESIKVTWRKAIESGEVNVILQINPKRHADLLNVPNAIEYAKSEEGRTLLRAAVHDPSAILRVYALPPGTPKERVKVLQNAFMATMTDPEFLAEMGKSNLAVDPVSGDEVGKIVEGFFKLRPAQIARLKEVLLPTN